MIRVLHDRVLVALPPKAHEQESATGYTYQSNAQTASGIILAKPADVYNAEIATRGIVVQVGEKTGMVDLDEVLAVIDELDTATAAEDVRRAMKALAPAPFDVSVGDCVLFSASSGDQIEDGGIHYVILHEHEILGVVEPLNTEEAA